MDNATTTTSKDILTLIAERDCATARKESKLCKRYQVCTPSRISSKLHTYATARRIVARLVRRGIDAYAAVISVRL